jgi:hypothetical protein
MVGTASVHCTGAEVDQGSQARGPIRWVAVADPVMAGMLYAANEPILSGASTIHTVDTTKTPAKIMAALPATRGGNPAQRADIEGLAADGEGGFRITSEGGSDHMIPHCLGQVNDTGVVVRESGLPPELAANEVRFGFEGVTKISAVLWVVTREPVQDFLPDTQAQQGNVVDRIEGLAIDVAGIGWAVTDNDGVDDSGGETYLRSIRAIN